MQDGPGRIAGTGGQPLREAEVLELVRRSRHPDAPPDLVDAARRAVDALFAASLDRIYWLCLRMVGRPELAAELAQETMLTGYRRLPEFRGDSSVHTWLFGIARNLCLRERVRHRDLLGVEHVFEPDDPATGPLAAMRREERDSLLAEARQAVLTPDEQEALILRYELGVSDEEITTMLHLTEASGARGLLQRCRRKLRRELERRLAELGHGHSLVFGSIGTEG